MSWRLLHLAAAMACVWDFSVKAGGWSWQWAVIGLANAVCALEIA